MCLNLPVTVKKRLKSAVSIILLAARQIFQLLRAVRQSSKLFLNCDVSQKLLREYLTNCRPTFRRQAAKIKEDN